jgi:LmbE family N-acetylglucosaminyl deacetylase
MIHMALNVEKEHKLSVLCLGAHCDDIEIGAGGIIIKLIDEYPNINFAWNVFSSDKTRAEEAYQSASVLLGRVKEKQISIKEFKESYFPYCGAEIKESFDQLKKEISPELILTHYRNDLHQDHRLISELTWNTFRDHLILEYEIPKYDGDFGAPNFYVNFDESTCQKKIQHILAHFTSQKSRQWFDPETFKSILRLRGIESNSPGKYAEAFYCRKITF